MPKDGERSYLRIAGAEAAAHAAAKPFSDASCPKYLAEMGAVLALLPPPPARILDLGCGTGWTSRFLARRGYDVVGQDIADDMIASAEEVTAREGLANLRFAVSDYERAAWRDEFDAVLFFDALHHAEDETAALRCAHAALRSGGVLLASEPGVGHSHSDEAREAVERYGVTEKDMPPSRSIRAGRAVGFTRFDVYPHANSMHTAAFRPFRFPLNLALVRAAMAAFVLVFYKRRAGIVVMRKP